MSEKKRTIAFDLTNVGGIASAHLELSPGLNLLTGRNGARKTICVNAITRALGDKKVPVAPTWGESVGYVNGPGVALRIGGKTTTTGETSVEMLDYGTLGDIVDPGVDGAVAADKARIQAILSYCPIPVGVPQLTALLGGDLELLDEAQRETILAAGMPVLTVRDLLKKAGSAGGVEAESRAKKLREQVQGIQSQLGTLPPMTPPSDDALDPAGIRTQLIQMGTNAKVLEEQVQRVSQLEIIRMSLGERPDLGVCVAAEAAAIEEANRAEDHLDAANQVVKDLEKRLADAKADQQAAKQRLEFAGAALRRAEEEKLLEERRIQRWDASKAALGDLDTLPSSAKLSEDLAELRTRISAEMALLEKTDATARARDLATERARQRAALEAQLEAAKANLEAEEATKAKYKALVAGLPRGVGECLRLAGIPNLTVVTEGEDADRLFYAENGEQSLFAERSFGQRVRTMLQIAYTANPSGVFPLHPTFLYHLEPLQRRELAVRATEMGLTVVSEWTSTGDLGYLHLTGAEDSIVFNSDPVGTVLPEAVSREPETEPTVETKPKLSLQLKL